MLVMENITTWIAIIDDEEGIRKALIRLLRSSGLDAYGFSSGKLFFQTMAIRKPACVVLDLNMPIMSGFEVIDQLAKLAPDIPVIIITGQTVTDRQIVVELAHAVRVLSKPINDQELFDVLAELHIIDQQKMCD